MQNPWGNSKTKFFNYLDPDHIMNAVERHGFKTSGRCLTLNSMENRVYEIEIERPEEDIKSVSDKFVVAKFYRPGRWSKEQILEEHEYLWDLKDNDLPVIEPIKFNGETLFHDKELDLYYCFFPRRGGRAPDEMTDEQVERMGRLVARMHSVGKMKKAKHRIELNVQTYGKSNLKYLLEEKIIPAQLEKSYEMMANQVISMIEPLFVDAPIQRVHGDLHWGNILWNDAGPQILDFDDMVVGPCVQDLWLCLPGRDEYALKQREKLISSYESMNHFDRRELKLIEPLRTLRFIHFNAWIARRWEDPAFHRAFPYFTENRYWEEQLQNLREQIDLISTQSAPLIC